MGEGYSRTEALERARAAIRQALPKTEITTVSVEYPAAQEAPPDPGLEKAGLFADDPSLDALLEEIYAARDAEWTE
jgi:hypothetical protein